MAVVPPRSLRVMYGSALTAAIDAGVTIIPAMPGRVITIHDAWVRAAGAADTATSVDISDGTTTVCVFTVAGLTDAAILRAGTTTTGVSTELGTALKGSTGIQLATVGAGLGTTTAIEYCVKYSVT